MTVLVLGGSGFIGSHVVDALKDAGRDVRVFDRVPERFRPPVPGVDYRFGQFSDRMAIIEALEGIDTVMHLVSTTFPGTAELDPRTDVQDNLVGTLNLLEAMLGLGVRRIVFLSSGGTVYGIPQQVPTPESHAMRPISSYGIVKAAIEHYLEMYRRTRGISPVVVRAANPYGPRQSHTGVQGVVTTSLRRVLDSKPIEVWGDGTAVRDFVHVRDLADLCALAAESEVEGTFNAGSGTGASVNEVVDLVRDVTGREVVVTHKPGRPIDVPRSVLDIGLARDAFGWSPQISLKDGMADTWRWMLATA